MRVHGEADFIVSGRGTEITCLPPDGLPAASMEQLLIDQVLPRTMHLRGEPCLHASAVELPGRGVVALIGPAGSGKSSLCAALCRRGGELVCDDSLRVVPTASGARVFTSYASLRLWPNAATALIGSGGELPAASPRNVKRRLNQRLATEPLSLARVLLLEPGPGPLQIERVSPSEAISLLAASLLRLDPSDSRALTAEFELLATIAERVRVERLRFRHDWNELDELVRTIMDST